MTDEAADRSVAEAADLAGRYGRHLFILAYHLCGEAGAAAGLAARVIARQARRPDLPGSDPALRSIELYRGLLGTWRSGRRAGKGRAAGPLHQALAGLDAEARVVTVLRIAEGFDYEEMAVLLGMPALRVRTTLVKARRHLLEAMHRREVDRRLDTVMTLYLDARLTGPDLAEFEKHLADDFALRGAVEFHRGLTLEFREEVPAPPADFARIVRQESDRLAGGGADWPARGTLFGVSRGAILAGVAVVAVAAALLLWRTGSDDDDPALATDPEAVAAVAGESDAPSADPETVGALRSLGYIGGAGPVDGAGPRAAPASRTAGSPRPVPEKPAPTPVADRPLPVETAPLPVEAAPLPVESAPPESVASPAPDAATPSSVEAAPSPTEAGPPQAAASPAPAEPVSIAHRVVPVPHPPPIGRDHVVVRSEAEWAAIAGNDGAALPPADLGTEMIVLLRGALGADPPTRLVVVGVRLVDDLLEVEARVEPIAQDSGAVAAGQAVIVAASDRSVRLVMR